MVFEIWLKYSHVHVRIEIGMREKNFMDTETAFRMHTIYMYVIKKINRFTCLNQ